MSAAKLAAVTPPDPQILEVNPRDLIIVTDKQHPLYVKRADAQPDRSLVEYMRQHGWTGTVQVAPTPQGFVVVAGRRRTKAAIEAGLQVILVEVLQASTVEQIRWMIAENQLRKEDDVFDLSRQVHVFMQEYVEAHRPKDNEGKQNLLWEPSKALLQEARRHAREATGRSESRFSDLLSLNRLTSKVVAAVRAGLISETAVLSAGLHNMAPERQDIQLAKMLAKGQTTREAAKAVREGMAKPPSRKKALRVAETRGVPVAVRQAILWLTGNLTEEELSELSWLQKAEKRLEKQTDE